jgi:hypothetical protein
MNRVSPLFSGMKGEGEGIRSSDHRAIGEVEGLAGFMLMIADTARVERLWTKS